MFFSRLEKNLVNSGYGKSSSSIATSSSVKIKTVSVKKPAERPLGLNQASNSHSVSKSSRKVSSNGSSTSSSRYASPVSRTASRNGSVTPRPRTTSNSTRNGSAAGNDAKLPSDYEEEDCEPHLATKRKISVQKKSNPSKRRSRSASNSDTYKSSRSSREYDDGYDDSSWQENFDRYSGNIGGGSTARNSVDAYEIPGNDNLTESEDKNLKSVRNFYQGNTKSVKVIEAKSLMKFAEYTPLFRGKKEIEYSLAMPCTPFRETYMACIPKVSDEFNPIVETEHIMELVANFYVPAEYTNEIFNPSLEDCIVRRYRESVKEKDLNKFMKTIQEYNSLVDKLRKDGSIDKHMKEQNKAWQKLGLLPRSISRSLLDQVYSRVVSPVANQLRDYKAFSNNVYGELLPDFMTRVFNETGLKSNMLFIDLGSGVGNCSLQAALEIGCESWGVEMMPNASNLATKQKIEMVERVKMYGLHIGELHLRAADFVHNDEIHKQVSNADVLLVNNYAFDGKLNSHLLDMFLDLKEGSRIISLKSFVPPGHKISAHNIQSSANLLSVERKEFPEGSVSWTIAPGPYFISTVDRSRLQKWLKKHGMI